jgi:hypothetical protein
MEVSVERFDDSSLPDEDGLCDYRYAGVVYTFEADGQKLIFRRYDDEPAVATLLEPLDWHADFFPADLFGAAVEYLHRQDGVITIKAYRHVTGTFAPIELPDKA